MTLRKRPRGSAILEIIVTAIFTVIGGVFLGGLVACAIGLICDDDDGGGGGQTVTINDPCSSAPNSCGMTNTGFYVDNGDGTASCNATAPSNSSCPLPSVGENGFYASPGTVGLNSSSTLNWSANDSTACTITGDNGFTHTGGSSGSVSTGALTQTTTFTLTCENGEGGPTTSKSLRIIVDPHYQEI